MVSRAGTGTGLGDIHGPTIHLLWTGGWDSTFRLIDLALTRKFRVQPYYLLDVSRRSTGHELLAMTRLRDLLERRDVAVRDRLLPIHFRDLRAIRPMLGSAAKVRLTGKTALLGGYGGVWASDCSRVCRPAKREHPRRPGIADARPLTGSCVSWSANPASSLVAVLGDVCLSAAPRTRERGG
jgi:hypothetical protein